MAKLTKIMKQRGDDKFIEVLKKWVGNKDDFADVLNSKLTSTELDSLLITYSKYILRLNQQIFIIRKYLTDLIQVWFWG